MNRKLLICLCFLIPFFSCKNEIKEEKATDNKSVIGCNLDSLKSWSSNIMEEKKEIYKEASKTESIISEDSSFIEVIWRYENINSGSINDELIVLNLDLIKDKIEIPNDYNLDFEYVLVADCPPSDDLPIGVNSEIRNLKFKDLDLNDLYEFSVTRGRISSGTKYLMNDSKKVTDTIQLSF